MACKFREFCLQWLHLNNLTWSVNSEGNCHIFATMNLRVELQLTIGKLFVSESQVTKSFALLEIAPMIPM